MPTPDPTSWLAIAPLNVALALAGENRAPLTATSSTYHPSKLLVSALDAKLNWTRTDVPTYALRSSVTSDHPVVGSVKMPGWTKLMPKPLSANTRLAAPPNRVVAPSRTTSCANGPPLVEIMTCAVSNSPVASKNGGRGWVPRKYLKFSDALARPAREIGGDVIVPKRDGPS